MFWGSIEILMVVYIRGRWLPTVVLDEKYKTITLNCFTYVNILIKLAFHEHLCDQIILKCVWKPNMKVVSIPANFKFVYKYLHSTFLSWKYKYYVTIWLATIKQHNLHFEYFWSIPTVKQSNIFLEKVYILRNVKILWSFFSDVLWAEETDVEYFICCRLFVQL